MGIDIGTTVNKDDEQTPTTGYFGDPGDGAGNKLYHWFRSAVIGEKADTAVTATDTTPGSVIALLKGVGSRLATIVTQTTTAATQLGTGATALLKAEDAPHASGDTGVQALAVRNDTASAAGTADGDYVSLTADALRRLRTLMTRDRTDTLSLVHMAAAANSQVVKGSSGVLHAIIGYVASGEAGWLQVHDATSAPADTAVPELSYYVAAASDPQPINIPIPGHVCGTGITLVWSTTGPTKTAGAAKMMVAAYYE